HGQPTTATAAPSVGKAVIRRGSGEAGIYDGTRELKRARQTGGRDCRGGNGNGQAKAVAVAGAVAGAGAAAAAAPEKCVGSLGLGARPTRQQQTTGIFVRAMDVAEGELPQPASSCASPYVPGGTATTNRVREEEVMGESVARAAEGEG
ncbi:unnamed protein product, partial [Discosporangium mesarthrocarpum]